MKLAIFGGKKTRIKKMPARFSFGQQENKEIKKMVNYYRKKGEDPKYSGEWEKKYCKKFSFFITTARPADPEKFEINFNLFGNECSEKNSSFLGIIYPSIFKLFII